MCKESTNGGQRSGLDGDHRSSAGAQDPHCKLIHKYTYSSLRHNRRICVQNIIASI